MPVPKLRRKDDEEDPHVHRLRMASIITTTKMVMPSDRQRRIRWWRIGVIAVAAALVAVGLWGMFFGPRS